MLSKDIELSNMARQPSVISRSSADWNLWPLYTLLSLLAFFWLDIGTDIATIVRVSGVVYGATTVVTNKNVYVTNGNAHFNFLVDGSQHSLYLDLTPYTGKQAACYSDYGSRWYSEDPKLNILFQYSVGGNGTYCCHKNGQGCSNDVKTIAIWNQDYLSLCTVAGSTVYGDYQSSTNPTSYCEPPGTTKAFLYMLIVIIVLVEICVCRVFWLVAHESKYYDVAEFSKRSITGSFMLLFFMRQGKYRDEFWNESLDPIVDYSDGDFFGDTSDRAVVNWVDYLWYLEYFQNVASAALVLSVIDTTHKFENYHSTNQDDHIYYGGYDVTSQLNQGMATTMPQFYLTLASSIGSLILKFILDWRYGANPLARCFRTPFKHTLLFAVVIALIIVLPILNSLRIINKYSDSR